MKKAILMSRVSSEEQSRGYSLDVQLDALKHYCDRNNIMVTQTIKEDHSAKSFDRPGLKECLNS